MIIGISGKIGSGKDTLANIIKQKCPSFVQKSFAYKLKKIGAFLTGTEEELWFTQEGKNIFLPGWEMTIGEFQQKLGTDAMRDGLHQSTWALALFADYTSSQNWLITDVRFPNEANEVKKVNGKLIRLMGDPAKVRANSTRNLYHPSETALDDYSSWDCFYNNVGTLKDLENFADRVITQYGLSRT